MKKTIIVNSLMAEDLGKRIANRGTKFHIGKAIYMGKDNHDLVELTVETNKTNREIVNDMRYLKPYCC